MVYFTLEIGIQEVSDLSYQLPEEKILLIKPERSSDRFYGLISKDYYDELLKNLPRECIHSLEIINKAEVMRFTPHKNKEAQFYGNINLLTE